MVALRGAAIVCILGGLWVAVSYGLGQAVLGRVSEPTANIAPRFPPDIGQDRALHILLLGTSLTDTDGWAEALGGKLTECRPTGVLVERLAKPGANSAWGEEALRARLASGQVPDILVVEFSINDSSIWRGMTLGASRARHEAILDMADKAGLTVFLATMNPAFDHKAWERPGQVAYRALYADLARSHGSGLVAMAPVWMALSASVRRRLVPDSLHPTEAAMAALAVPAFLTALGGLVCTTG